MNTPHFKGLIFDLDGTLADSALDFDAMRRELALPKGTPLLEHLATLSCPDARQRFHAVVERHEMIGAENARWIADAEQTLFALNKRRIPLAIVTRNMRSATRRTIERLQIPIELVLTREDVEQVKPHPEALLRIAREWQLPPGSLAYVGDYTFDLDAAHAAGMGAILWRNEHNAHLAPHAHHCIDRFGQLLDLVRSE
ncbi:HAD family hydrolase [Simiduia agarivorans]|uniref:phosphoglycolate phosphatase n=1 Tax=Simiduia agarivorans (strain DSM 21679 / JCM 13881 / BCRC 17597 / SA1) TaxID=1117647 RepID=K4KJJ6_SIMAS|nr:HAD family hydrolase [Simiduia agarivorans]AFU98395.1 phosphatase [Simiduia agarivorans SA1 = DSM 21679]